MGLKRQKTAVEQIEEATRSHGGVLDLAQTLQEAVDKLTNSSEEVRLTRKTTKLKEQLVDQEIEHKKQQEEWEREKREVEHKIGLQRKRGEEELELAKKTAEQDQAHAVRAAELTVREGNLETKEGMLKQQMEALQTDLRAQIEYLRTDVLQQLVKVIPNFNVEMILDPHGSRDQQAEREHPKGELRTIEAPKKSSSKKK